MTKHLTIVSSRWSGRDDKDGKWRARHTCRLLLALFINCDLVYYL